jgi:hypothetical protein
VRRTYDDRYEQKSPSLLPAMFGPLPPFRVFGLQIRGSFRGIFAPVVLASFEHNGSVASLEDWFDPRRLRDDYVPTGWKEPPGTKTRAVKGHEYGLDLQADERNALIAYLRTL